MYGCATLATIAIGDGPTSGTDARSFTGENGRLGISEGFTPCVSNTTPNVYPSGGEVAKDDPEDLTSELRVARRHHRIGPDFARGIDERAVVARLLREPGAGH